MPRLSKASAAVSPPMPAPTMTTFFDALMAISHLASLHLCCRPIHAGAYSGEIESARAANPPPFAGEGTTWRRSSKAETRVIGESSGDVHSAPRAMADHKGVVAV